MKKIIYLDHAAGTLADQRVQKIMQRVQSEVYGNPSALYALGTEAKNLLNLSRQKVADVLCAQPQEIIFTSSATEANNTALIGVAFGARHFGKHIITTQVEHPSVIRTCMALENEGFEVTYLPPDHDGMIRPEVLAKALRPDTILVSIMYANNEIGTVQPIADLSKLKKQARKKQITVSKSKKHSLLPPYFHTDACQAAPYLSLDVQKLGVDLMTMNGSKLYGPRGSAVLYMKNNVAFSEVFFGGGQEFGRRPGTENLAAIAGFGTALMISEKIKNKESKRLSALRDFCFDLLAKYFPNVIFNGDRVHRLPNNIHFTLPGLDAEACVLFLSQHGICVGLGAACSSGKVEPSHVLRAIGVSSADALSSLRVTLGRENTKQDLIVFVKTLKKIVERFL